MKITAGLGNPGNKYIRNRHNIGFLIIDNFAARLGIKITEKKFSSLSLGFTGETGDHLFLKPQTFMNNSGEALKKAMAFFKADASSLLVIHDEIELPFGDVRYKFGGGHKGQNGLRSIIAMTGTPDFHRIRFGVGRSPHNPGDVASHVLSDFSADEYDRLDEGFEKAWEFYNSFINGSI